MHRLAAVACLAVLGCRAASDEPARPYVPPFSSPNEHAEARAGRADDRPVDRLVRAARVAGDAAAIDALVAWHRAGAALPDGECLARVSEWTVDVERVGSAALQAASPSADDPRVAATLGLARALIDGRESQLELAVGMSLLSKTADWVADHGLVGEVVLPGAPTDADLLAVLEREAHCAVVGAELMAEDPKGSELPASRHYLASMVERTRQAGADLIAGARTRMDDRTALVAYLAEVDRGLKAEAHATSVLNPSTALVAAFLLTPARWGRQVTARDELAAKLTALAER